MKTHQGLAILEEYAKKGATEEERIAVYEALAVLADAAGLPREAESARKTGEQLRAADRAQLDFRALLEMSADYRPREGGDGDGHGGQPPAPSN
jgi:hypothetical protein